MLFVAAAVMVVVFVSVVVVVIVVVLFLYKMIYYQYPTCRIVPMLFCLQLHVSCAGIAREQFSAAGLRCARRCFRTLMES